MQNIFRVGFLLILMASAIGVYRYYNNDSTLLGTSKPVDTKLQLTNAKITVYSPTAQTSFLFFTPQIALQRNGLLEINNVASYLVNPQDVSQIYFVQTDYAQYHHRVLYLPNITNIFNVQDYGQFQYANIKNSTYDTVTQVLTSEADVNFYGRGFITHAQGFRFDLKNQHFNLYNNVYSEIEAPLK